MKQKSLLIVGLLAAVLLSGCVALPQLVYSWLAIDSVESTGPVEPIEEYILPDAEQAVTPVRQAAAQAYGVEADAVEVLAVEEVSWPNACLGLANPDEMCAEVITPGYRIVVQVADQQVAYRTNLTGSVIRPEDETPEATPAPEGEQVAMIVRQMLMQQLGANFDAIEIVAVEEAEWPNGCLGLAAENEFCTEMIVPGYRVVLAVNGEQYVYRTDAEGMTIRLESTPEAQIGEVLVEWTQNEDEGVCTTAQIGRDGVAFGLCGNTLMSGVSVNPDRAAELEEFASTYAPFEAATAAGHVVFAGEGEQEPTPAEQRMIAEWARLVQLEATGGRSGASWGLAFAWHREGGIAGFCDDLTVYVTGQVYASSCQGNEPSNLGQTRLDAAQLAQVYEWVDTLQSFEVEQADDAVADAMTIRMVFSGAGEQEASEEEIAAIQEFAAQRYAELSQ